jgi:YbbR domain-containing protein
MKKIRSIKAKILNNIGIKTLSLILAIILWLVARINS